MSSSARVIAAVAMSQVLVSTLALSTLDIYPFDDLLKESSLIAVARVTDAQIDDLEHGRAHLKVERVVRGQYQGGRLTIQWSGREDEQRTAEVGREYLLFLRKTDDGYTAAIHGVSYWSITYTGGDRQAVEYTYPIDSVTVAGELIMKVDLPPGLRPGAKGCTLELISLDRLVQAIRGKRAGTG